MSAGLGYVVAAAFAGSLGAVLMKQMENIAALRFQAWVGLVSLVPLAIGSWAFEHGQWTTAAAAGFSAAP